MRVLLTYPCWPRCVRRAASVLLVTMLSPHEHEIVPAHRGCLRPNSELSRGPPMSSLKSGAYISELCRGESAFISARRPICRPLAAVGVALLH